MKRILLCLLSGLIMCMCLSGCTCDKCISKVPPNIEECRAIDDNFVFIRDNILYAYSDSAGIEQISDKNISECVTKGKSVFYTDRELVWRYDLDSKSETLIYKSETYIQNLRYEDKLKICVKSDTGHKLIILSDWGELISEEDYDATRYGYVTDDQITSDTGLVYYVNHEIYDFPDGYSLKENYQPMVILLGAVNDEYIVSVVKDGEDKRVLATADKEGTVTIIEGYNVHLDMFSTYGSNCFIFCGEAESEDMVKVYAYIPETDEVRMIYEDVSDMNRMLSALLTEEYLYMWDSDGGTKIVRYKVNRDENRYPVRLEFDRAIFESDI